MKQKKTRFKGLIIYSGIKFNDTRGYFREIFKQTFLKKKMIFWCMSKSKKKCFERNAFTNKKSTR